jgi:hypothetical protein
MGFIPVRILNAQEQEITKSVGQKFYCEICHEETGNGLRRNALPHHEECGEHHNPNEKCHEEN